MFFFGTSIFFPQIHFTIFILMECGIGRKKTHREKFGRTTSSQKRSSTKLRPEEEYDIEI